MRHTVGFANEVLSNMSSTNIIIVREVVEDNMMTKMFSKNRHTTIEVKFGGVGDSE